MSLHGASTMRFLHLRKINLVLFSAMIICLCSPDERGGINTSIKFLYEDCLNEPLKHNTYIPSNITKLKVVLMKNNLKIIESEYSNNESQTSIVIQNIPPDNGYDLYVNAYTKDGSIWSGFAQNLEIKEKSKTFVQINLTKELSLTCTDNMNKERFLHSSELLNDGRVLIFGGASVSNKELDLYHIEATEKVEVYYPYKIEYANNVNPSEISGSFSTLKSGMISGRIGYIYEKLPDGKILIAGGINKATFRKNPDGFFMCLDDNTVFIYDIEIFDPEKNSFNTVGRLSSPRAFASSAFINNKIYIIGGINSDFDCNNVVNAGLNPDVAIIDLSSPASIKVTEKSNADTAFISPAKIKLSENRFLFFGGNQDYGIILETDGSIKKVNFIVSQDFNNDKPQIQYLPYIFTIKQGGLYLSAGGYYKDILSRFFIKYLSDKDIRIEKDPDQNDLLFGSGYAQYGNYLFQIGGIMSLPFTISDSIIIRRLSENGYTVVKSDVSKVNKLTLERAFSSVTYIGNNNLLITGGIKFNQANDAIILNMGEIYNGNGLPE